MVRFLTPDDAPAFVRLRRFMLLDTPWAFGSSPEVDRKSNIEHVAASVTQPGQAIAGVFRGDELVSTAALAREEVPKRAHIAFIYTVYTHPSARRRGYAHAVLSELIALARTWPGVMILMLSVSDRSPAARALYESLGFRAWGTEPDALRIGDECADEIHMFLRL